MATAHNGAGGGEGDRIFPRWFTPPAILPDTDIWILVDRITDFLMTITIPIATIFYIWAAFLYLTSGGNESKIKTAHQAVIWTTIGLAVVLLARGLAAIIQNVFSMASQLIS